MLSAAIIASIPAATSVVNTLSSAVLEQVREGSESFAAALSDALTPEQSGASSSSTRGSSVKEAFDGLAGSLRSHVERLSQLRELIRDRLQSAGIKDLQGVQLELSPSDGQVAVVGDHPDKARIESILAKDPTVAAAMKSIGSVLRLNLDVTDALAMSK